MSNDRLIDSLWEQLIKARADNVRLEVAHERFYQEIMRLRELLRMSREHFHGGTWLLDKIDKELG